MTKLALGPIGVASQEISHGDPVAALDAAAELEELGYATIWLHDLGRIAEIVRGTSKVAVASGIIAIVGVTADEVARSYADLEATHPGRFVVGLGGAHGPQPIARLTTYFDQLDTGAPTVPARARVLAALGPRMLRLARERTSGAFPVLITPDYTARARAVLGDDTSLIVQQFVVVEPDVARARTIARNGPIGFLSQLPQYVASFRRMGFGDDDIAGMNDRLIDGVVACGDVDVVAQRVGEHRRAGADQVAISVISPPGQQPRATWNRLAEALL
jgi:probable F420-dependent oxidoreductase